MNLQLYLGLGLVLLAALLLILQNWRRGIYILFAWLLFEDIIRRIIPGQPIQLQVVKEVLLLWTYLSFVLTWRAQGRRLWQPPFLASLVVFSAVVLTGIFNPELPGFFVPLLGIRSYLWYVPLLWIGYHAFRTRAEIIRFCRVQLSTAIPLAALGVIQYVLWDRLPLWLKPLEGAHAFHSASFDYEGTTLSYEAKLPSSVFGTAHRFAMFSVFLLFLGIGIWGWNVAGPKQRRRVFLGFSIVASLVCIVIAGARIAMLLTVAGLLLQVVGPVLTHRGGFIMKRARVQQLLVSLMLGGAFFLALRVFSETGKFFLYTTADDVQGHWQQFTQGQLPFVLKKAAWLGFGTGSISQGVTYVPGGRTSFEFVGHEAGEVGVEYGLAKVTWELGIVGLLAFLVLWGHILRSLWRELRAVRDPAMKALARTLGIFSLIIFVAFLKGHYYFGDGTTLVLYWFGMGMFFSLRRVERLENLRLQRVHRISPEWSDVQHTSIGV